MQEKRRMHNSGSRILPLIGLKQKNKTGLTQNKLIQHEELSKKLSLTQEK